MCVCVHSLKPWFGSFEAAVLFCNPDQDSAELNLIWMDGAGAEKTRASVFPSVFLYRFSVRHVLPSARGLDCFLPCVRLVIHLCVR